MKKNYILTALLITISLCSIAQTPPSIQWQKSFGGSNGEYPSILGFEKSIISTSDGGYLIATYSTSVDGDVSGNHGGIDGWLLKLDVNGIIQWQKSVGGSMDDWLLSAEQTSDGGYIVAGLTTSSDGDVTSNHGSEDVWVVKLDNSGAIQWQKSLGGTGDDAASSIKQTADGGYIIAASTTSNDGDVSGNHSGANNISSDYWIIKIDSSGTIEWQKCLGGSSVNGGFATGNDVANSISQASDGGYIVAGYTTSNDGDITGYHGTYEPDYWIVKLDGNGTIEWQKCLGGTEEDEAFSVQQTTDGGYIIAGHTDSNDGDLSGGNYTEYDFDYWIIKLSSEGVLQWQKRFGGSGPDYGNAIKQTSDDGYIIAGYSSSNDRDVSGNHKDSVGNNSPDYWIIKVDSSGTLQWQKSLGGSDVDQGYSIYPTPDKGYIIAGLTYSNDGDVSNNHGNGDVWVVKLSPDNILPVSLISLSGEENGKQNILHWSTASEQNNTGFEVQRSIDGNNFSRIDFVNTKASNGNSMLTLNYDFSDIGFAASTNYYRLKQIDKDGKFIYSNIVVLRDRNLLAENAIIVYPNPVVSNATLRLTEDLKNASVSITNMNGKMLWQSNNVNAQLINLPVEKYAAGTYLIIITNGKEGKTIKLIKQ